MKCASCGQKADYIIKGYSTCQSCAPKYYLHGTGSTVCPHPRAECEHQEKNRIAGKNVVSCFSPFGRTCSFNPKKEE